MRLATPSNLIKDPLPSTLFWHINLKRSLHIINYLYTYIVRRHYYVFNLCNDWLLLHIESSKRQKNPKSMNLIKFLRARRSNLKPCNSKTSPVISVFLYDSLILLKCKYIWNTHSKNWQKFVQILFRNIDRWNLNCTFRQCKRVLWIWYMQCIYSRYTVYPEWTQTIFPSALLSNSNS
jgi:hypothetical protein